jgi:hypothetical protein
VLFRFDAPEKPVVYSDLTLKQRSVLKHGLKIVAISSIIHIAHKVSLSGFISL